MEPRENLPAYYLHVYLLSWLHGSIWRSHSTTGSMQLFVLYSLSGLAIAVFFVATIFTDQPERTKVRWVRFSQQSDDEERPPRMRPSDPVEAAINVTHVSDTER